MDLVTFGVQLLNAIQYGMVLFLVASGLTLVFGIMDFVNLAHGSLYMIGAFACAAIAAACSARSARVRVLSYVVLAHVYGS